MVSLIKVLGFTHTATYCNTLLHTATTHTGGWIVSLINVLGVNTGFSGQKVCCSVLQSGAVCCSVLQCVAG